MNDKLVLHEREFHGANSIKAVAVVNDLFNLGVDAHLDGLSKNVQDVLETLRAPYIGDADALLHVATMREAAKSSQEHSDYFPNAAVWREIGYPDIAAVFDDWHALADDVKIKLRYQGTVDEHPIVLNADEINANCKKLRRRLDSLVDDLPFTANEIEQTVCDMFAIDLRPEHLFRKYWIDRIVNSSGFAQYAPPLNKDGLPHDEPFGWLTKRHVKALKAHGYAYRFAFWQEAVGDTRGHLWIQTDQGPLVLSDQTDSVSLKTNFPVQVSSLARRKKFKLRERDLEGKPRGGNILLRMFGRK
ncbi:hypothetical protein [Yoonia sp. 208BN28-4]|uniref:hypothetical protein n=1 Tax=Yoonia sp. 208BN28-4 TaxID=3126505 RepID=UPI0030EEE8D0